VAAGEKVSLSKRDLKYIKIEEQEIDNFFERLNTPQEFGGLKILDVGCGQGRLCFRVAEKGADKVVGIDINADVISFANKKLKEKFPHLCQSVEFDCIPINELGEYDFDMIIAKDSFEHIIGLEDCLNEMTKRLKQGGRILIGFGPLYNSPYGDHKRTKSIIPWGHLLRSEESIVKGINKQASA
jgi:2-polyprenyl-3-methyl-5-hydroxy-6-metoxy-1,4-benzoquinol methylase